MECVRNTKKLLWFIPYKGAHNWEKTRIREASFSNWEIRERCSICRARRELYWSDEKMIEMGFDIDKCKGKNFLYPSESSFKKFMYNKK
jgi:hypothetical protein